MLTKKIQLKIKNFPAQDQIFNHPARFKIASKGRRFGLTKGAANDFIQCALERKFKQGLWVDTVMNNIDRYVERYFLPTLTKLPKEMWNWRKQAKILEMVDSYIDFRSADRPENIEGFGYDKVFLNEAGIILNNPYLWDNAIRPMLWEYKPQTVIGGTPKGKNQFYELSLRGQDPNQPEYQFFHYTSFDNPYLDHDALAEDMRSMPEMVVKQEVYAEFLEDTGVVFRGVRAIANAKPEKPKNGHMYVIGVDIAKVQDFTVLAVYDRKTNKQVYQARFNKLEWPFQKKKIIEISRYYNNALVILDATGIGDPIADDLTRAGVPIEPYKLTNPSKKELIEKLAIWIEQQKIEIINNAETLAEFNAFTYDISNSGRIMYNAPVGFHDDIVIAHGLAVWSLQPIYAVKKSEPVPLIRQEYQRLKHKGVGYDQDYEYI
jgi:hypothetical protein